MRRNRCASQRATKAKVFSCTETRGEPLNKTAGRSRSRQGAGADKPSIDLDQKIAGSRDGADASMGARSKLGRICGLNFRAGHDGIDVPRSSETLGACPTVLKAAKRWISGALPE